MFSILFSEPIKLKTVEPECFRDLNLDRFLEPVLKNEKYMELAPYFYTPLPSENLAVFRQEIQKDLLRKDNLKILDQFSQEICRLADLEDQRNEDLISGDPWRCHYLLYGHILDEGEQYVRCISGLCRRLPDMDLCSEGLSQAGDLLEKQVKSPFFQRLIDAQTSLRQKFNGLRYMMQIRYGTVRVKKYEGEENLSEKITALFRKFQSDPLHDYRRELKEEPFADHVEASLLQCLSRLYPREFEALSAYVKDFSRCIDRDILQFCREIRFYIDWLLYIEPMKTWGLSFCFPEFQNSDSFAADFFDLMLAKRIGKNVVRNDFELRSAEKLLVVTGPNQGGKTTFARSLGQIHFLAALGLCVPGTSARLRLTDRVLTHFGREDPGPERTGRLQDDLQRLHDILSQASERSFLVINEIFASTPAEDGINLGKKMIEQITSKGCTGVLVTFLSELTSCTPATVSMLSTVDPEDPEVRTFRILRKPAAGVTYAMTLAKRHGLSFEQVMRRLGK